jgi:hypothetical protein
LEHVNSCEIIVNVLAIIRSILVDGTQYRDEVFLAQLVDVVVDYKLEASEAGCNHLIIIYNVGYARNCQDNKPPSVILELLPASLNNLLHALEGLELV